MYHHGIDKTIINMRRYLSYQERRRDRPYEARQPVHFRMNVAVPIPTRFFGSCIDEKGGCERIHCVAAPFSFMKRGFCFLTARMAEDLF